MAYDTNPRYTADYIYGNLKAEISKNCILWRGSAFSFFSSIKFVYYEKYERNGRVWKITGDGYQKQAASALSNVETAIQMLPCGVQAELLIRKTNDQRENPSFYEDCFEMGVIYTIKINVDASFSKAYYTSVSQGILVHSTEISDTFKRDAGNFYCRIKEKHMDVVEKIGKEICDYFHGSDYYFTVYRDEITVRDWKHYNFEKYGMAMLPSMESVYGLAMAIIEFLAKGSQCKYQLLYNEYCIKVEKCQDAPSALQEW